MSEMKFNAHLPMREQEKQNNIVNKISENSENTGSEVFLILWFLGAGKTTLLKDLAGYLANQWEQFKVIVNDIGKYNIDAERLKDFSPVALTDWCICCQDLSWLKTALEELKGSNEKILIEPSGIADGKAIKRVIEELGMQGRVITLVNAQSFPTMSKAEEQIASTQLSLANVIALTHLPSDKEKNQELRSQLSQKYPHQPVIEAPYTTNSEDLMKDDSSYEAIVNLMRKYSQDGHAECDHHHHEHEHEHEHDHEHDHHHHHHEHEHEHEHEHDHHHHHHEHEHEHEHDHHEHEHDHHEHEHGHHHHEHSKFFTKSIALSEETSLDQLKALIDQLGQDALRVKWVIKYWSQPFEFDYVRGGELEIWNMTTLHPHLNVITQHSLSPELIAMISSGSTSSEKLSYVPEKKIYSPIEVSAAVSVLLNQYKDYMNMYNQKLGLETEYAKNQDSKLAQEIQQLDIALDKLWDDMKFDNPLIWIGYKRLAYANNPEKKVETIWELKKHCERKTDICHKRLDFLNEHLKSDFWIDLFDENQVKAGQSLVDFIKENEAIKKLSQDEQFMTQWLQNEYFQIDGKVAKWQNYQSVH